jgi:hypothetical protein
VQNGAPSQDWRASDRPAAAVSTDEKLGGFKVCDLARWTWNLEKWRFWPSKKRQFLPFSPIFLMVFPGFFSELGQQGANGRELGA